jgi:hypothetical protein
VVVRVTTRHQVTLKDASFLLWFWFSFVSTLRCAEEWTLGDPTMVRLRNVGDCLGGPGNSWEHSIPTWSVSAHNRRLRYVWTDWNAGYPARIHCNAKTKMYKLNRSPSLFKRRRLWTSVTAFLTIRLTFDLNRLWICAQLCGGIKGAITLFWQTWMEWTAGVNGTMILQNMRESVNYI